MDIETRTLVLIEHENLELVEWDRYTRQVFLKPTGEFDEEFIRRLQEDLRKIDRKILISLFE